tara:strand:- start:218 stop:427 length:210 start_codon:yes stop_codon:yes gene_type:complete
MKIIDVKNHMPMIKRESARQLIFKELREIQSNLCEIDVDKRPTKHRRKSFESSMDRLAALGKILNGHQK